MTQTTNIYDFVEIDCDGDGVDIIAARGYYATAILLSNDSEVTVSDLDTVVRLLDKALNLVPSLTDAILFRQEIWHEILKESEHTEDKQSEYNRYLKSDAWMAKRACVLNLRDHRCDLCNEKATEVHHKTYDNVGQEPFNDLTALCKSCHTRYEEDKKEKRLPVVPSGKPEHEPPPNVINTQDALDCATAPKQSNGVQRKNGIAVPAADPPEIIERPYYG